MKEAFKRLALRHLSLILYGTYSIIVTILDVAIVWTLMHLFPNMPIVVANTAGVVAGFLAHYLLSSKSVFKTNYSSKGFIIYFLTFLLNLVFADWIISFSYQHLFLSHGLNNRLLLSKGLSIVIPFFAIYYLRKFLYGKFTDKQLEKSN